jgi:uncharacterized Zn finger protein
MCFKEFIMCADYEIRGRGKDYYLSGRVYDLKRTNDNAWTARISGSREYKARISTDGMEVDYWKCSCLSKGRCASTS